MRKSRGREETRLGKAAFTGYLPSKYRSGHALTSFLHFLRGAYFAKSAKTYFEVFETICLRLYGDPSTVTLHRDGALVARPCGGNRCREKDKAGLDQRCSSRAVGQKRWIPEPESRAFPKTPDQRFLSREPGQIYIEM